MTGVEGTGGIDTGETITGERLRDRDRAEGILRGGQGLRALSAPWRGDSGSGESPIIVVHRVSGYGLLQV